MSTETAQYTVYNMKTTPWNPPGWSVIISAFAGTGKTYLALNQKQLGIRILDLDHEQFMWNESEGQGPSRNPNFIRDYIAKLYEVVQSREYDVIFVSYLQPIRQAMTREGFIFQTVFPDQKLGAEYGIRLMKAGRSQQVIGTLLDNWDSYMAEWNDPTYMGWRQFMLRSGHFMDLKGLLSILEGYGSVRGLANMTGNKLENVYDLHKFFYPEDDSKTRLQSVKKILNEIRIKDIEFQGGIIKKKE